MANARELLPEVRDQGDRLTCLCMALSDGHHVARGTAPSLSVDFLHFKAATLAGVGVNDGVPDWAGMDALDTLGQPAEAECPYSPTDRDPSWQPPVPSGPVLRHRTTGGAHDWATLASSVAAGKPIVIALDIDDAFWTPVNGLVEEVDGPERASHAVLAVAVAEGIARVLVRNSWGPDWGDNGHAWISASYLAARCTGIITFEGANQ